MNSEKTVAFKLNGEIQVGILSDKEGDSSVTEMKKLEKAVNMEMNENEFYIVLISEDKESEKNSVYMLMSMPVLDENGRVLTPSTIPEDNHVHVCNELLANFRNKVTYH